MKTKILFLTLILYTGMLQCLSAQTMQVLNKNNTTDMYTISDIRKITYNDSNVVINLKNGTEDNKDITTISNITFNNVFVSISQYTQVQSLLVYPNPATDMVMVGYLLSSPSPISIKIYSVTGQIVKEVIMGTQPKGKGSYTFYTTDFPSNGTYICKVFIDTQILTQKIIIIK